MILRINKAFLFVLIFFFIQTIFAQDVNLKGRLLDENQNPIAYSNILLLNENEVIQASFSDEKGIFSIQSKAGEFNLKVHLFDNLLHSQKVQLTSDTNLGDIIINTALKLDAVQLESQKKLIERKADRLIFNTEHSIAGKGGSAIDALKATPGIMIQQKDIKVIGKSGMSLMVNDVMKNMTGDELYNYLRSIRANEIKRIEVITNPPAKYSAEGSAGILHLIIEQDKENHWSNNISASYTQSKYAELDINNNFSYKKDKLSLGAKLGYTDGTVNGNIDTDYFYPTQILSDEQVIKSKFKYLAPQVGLDYEFSDNLRMGIQYDYFSVDTDKRSRNDIYYKTLTHEIDSISRNKEWVFDDDYYHTLNYYSLLKLDDNGKQIRFDFDLFSNHVKYHSENEVLNYLPNGDISDYTPDIPSDNLNRKNTDYNLRLDMEHPTDWIDLNYGLGFSFLDIENKIDYLNKNQETELISDLFTYKENKQAAYISGNKSFGEKWNAQIGLRAESSQVKTISESTKERHSTNHTSLFPTLYISYNPGDKHNWNLNYGRRINRPNFMFLNPFKTQESPYAYTQGNPLLKASYSNNLELNYLYDMSLNFQVFYSHINRGFDYLNKLDAESLEMLSSPENYLKSDAYGISISYNKSLMPWWETYANTVYSYAKANSYFPEVLQKTKGNSWFFNMSNTFVLSENINFNLSYFYSAAGTQELNKNKARSSLDAHLVFYFLDKDLELSLSASDIFETNRYKSSTFYDGIKSYSEIFIENSFRISLNYKFGNKKIQSRDYSENENIYRM